ncbi:MAG: hypothetical protein WA823_19620, partial [Candidatus Acidiferrales bacterium]
MELFLNLLWAVMAVAALGAWRAQGTSDSRRPGIDPWRAWAAFTCAAVLMFFVVSLSDDLRAEYLCADECTSARRQT